LCFDLLECSTNSYIANSMGKSQAGTAPFDPFGAYTLALKRAISSFNAVRNKTFHFPSFESLGSSIPAAQTPAFASRKAST
jgi:hypothetical protein